ncbi:MAG: CBS domain-containing protein [Alphaproteobacteria bacterium]|nr:CBS domain-containing protein [Alphaproteobacteria bacterium]
MTFASLPAGIGATPLAALPAISLDLETTGLDVTTARVIEIGAVRLSASTQGAAPNLSTLVDPGVPIPAVSTAVHGISDADVAGAPPFTQAIRGFGQWAGPAVVVGFAIGFDLAILKSEHERHGLAWAAPRSLDVRHLLEFLSPALGSLSLDAAAARFLIAVSDRHRALADAQLAAAIFKAVLPMLREKGIRTLAQAERAIDQRTGQNAQTEGAAGWVTAATPADTAGSIADFARIDSFAFRHRVGELMQSPPLAISGDTPLRAALKRMAETKVSSLFVEGTQNGTVGIITERDVLRALARDDAAVLDAPVRTVAAPRLVTIARDEFVYRALAIMSSRGFRHLGVTDEEGRLVGALSARDLLRGRTDDAVALGLSIEKASSPDELGRIWLNLPKVARALDLEEVDVRDTTAVISRELRAMTRRACELAEQALTAEGFGPPPSRYAMMVLGSGGRGESLLAMDQDNAIVYEEPPGGKDVDAWFERLGKRVADYLDAAGVVYCKGGVMASNAAWRMNVERWKATTRSWIARNKPENILSSDIFFDAVTVHGEPDLFEEVWSDAVAHAGQSRSFQSLLALSATDSDTPFGWTGRVKLVDGRIDLKRFGLMPIFSSARVLALRHAIRQRSTRNRLTAAAQIEGISTTLVTDLLESHRFFLQAILRQQLRDISTGHKLSNSVALGELSAFERQELNWALHQVPRVADLLGTPPKSF